MAADKWLEDELAELDQAELFIQQTMSDFLPTSKSDQSSVTANNREVTTTTVPKIDSDLDKLTDHLIGEIDLGKKKEQEDSFNLPPPPDLDDLIISKKQETPKSDLPPPPPPEVNHKPPPPPEKKAPPPVMSKPAPPPVLPKPSRSTALKARKAKVENNSDAKKPSAIPSLDAGLKPPPASAIPKDIQKNSVEELDFLTNNLLSNMDHPKDEDFYGYCEKCNSVVEGEKVGCNALGGVYHIKCFVCETCKKELHGEPFYAVEKTTYCEPCYIVTLEKCTVCSETITDRILRATGKPYHPHCFKCSECGKSLDGIPFTVDESNTIFCVEDYHQKYAPRCSVCELPILPEPGKEETVRIVAMDRSFHVACYKCEKCGVQLSSDKGCYPLDNHIYCLQCNNTLQQERAAA